MKDSTSSLPLADADIIRLIDEARIAQLHSYAPYSHFNVGASLLSQDGTVTTGCNIENAAFAPTCCAERTAFFKAISNAEPHSAGRSFRAIAIVGGKNMTHNEHCPPCGVCRQVMREFCKDDFAVITSGADGQYKIATLGGILPESFGPENVES